MFPFRRRLRQHPSAASCARFVQAASSSSLLQKGSASWVPIIQVEPSGSANVPQRSLQNLSITGPCAVAPRPAALAITLSTFSPYTYRPAGEPPRVLAVRLPHCGIFRSKHQRRPTQGQLGVNSLAVRTIHDATQRGPALLDVFAATE